MADRPTESSTARTSTDYAYPSQNLMEQEHTDDADDLPLLSQPPSTHSLQQGKQARAASAKSASPVPSRTIRTGSQSRHRQQDEHNQQASQQQTSALKAAQSEQSPHLTIPSPPPPNKPSQSSPPKSPQQPQSSPVQVPHFDAAARLELYRVLVGILPSPHVPSDPLSLSGHNSHHRLNPFQRSHHARQAPTSNNKALPLRAKTNIGVYYRILRAEKDAHNAYRFYATVINLAYLLVIALSATITALSAYSSSSRSPTSIAVTVMGAVNAAATALVAYLKARGLPTRKLLYKNQLRRVREYAEFRERQFAVDAKLGIVGAATVVGVVNAEDFASLAISTPNIMQGAAAGNDVYTPGGAAGAGAGGGSGGGGGSSSGKKAAAGSSSGSPKSSDSSAGNKSGGPTGSPPSPGPNTSTPHLTAGGAILLDPVREAAIVEQMYWAAREDEEANYPETYSYGGKSLFGGDNSGGRATAQSSGGSPASASGAQSHFHYHPLSAVHAAQPGHSAQSYQGQYRDGYSHGYGASPADPQLQPQSEKQAMQIQHIPAPAPLQTDTQDPSREYHYGYDGSHDHPSTHQRYPSAPQTQSSTQPTQHPAQPPRLRHNDQRIQSTYQPSSSEPAHPPQQPQPQPRFQSQPTVHGSQQSQHRTTPSRSASQSHSNLHNSWNAMAAWTDTGLGGHGTGVSTDLGGGGGSARYIPLAPVRTFSGAGGRERGRGGTRSGGVGSVIHEYV